MSIENDQSNIIKKEDVGYLKSSLNLMPGTLCITKDAICLDAHRAATNGFGLLGLLIRSAAKPKTKTIFALPISKVMTVKQGKHGLQKNVLEITDAEKNTYRIIVKDYSEWENIIKSSK
jgi:hypothetical protein